MRADCIGAMRAPLPSVRVLELEERLRDVGGGLFAPLLMNDVEAMLLLVLPLGGGSRRGDGLRCWWVVGTASIEWPCRIVGRDCRGRWPTVAAAGCNVFSMLAAWA